MNYLAITLNLKLPGIALATTLTSLVMITIPLVYACYNVNVRDAICWPDSSVFKGWMEYLKLAVPSAGIFCAEYWAYLILAWISVFIDAEAYTNFLIMMQIAWLVNSCCLGI